jgi:hypothetical protein
LAEQCGTQPCPPRTRYFTERKLAGRILAERSLQLGLAAKVGLVGSYAYDSNTEMVQISQGYAAIHGLPEDTTEITRSQWLAQVHPEDVARLQLFRKESLSDRQGEYKVDYRIVRRHGEVRWIEFAWVYFLRAAALIAKLRYDFCGGIKAENAKQFVGRKNEIGVGVPIPTADMGQPLRFAKLDFPLTQRLLGMLAFGDVAGDSNELLVGHWHRARQYLPSSPSVLD